MTRVSDAFTGNKSHRPQLDLMLKELKVGDTIAVTKLDRIARSVSQGMEHIQSLCKRSIVSILPTNATSVFRSGVCILLSAIRW